MSGACPQPLNLLRTYSEALTLEQRKLSVMPLLRVTRHIVAIPAQFRVTVIHEDAFPFVVGKLHPTVESAPLPVF